MKTQTEIEKLLLELSETEAPENPPKEPLSVLIIQSREAINQMVARGYSWVQIAKKLTDGLKRHVAMTTLRRHARAKTKSKRGGKK